MARVLVKVGEKTVNVSDIGVDPISIGRDLENDIVIDHVAVSMRHAELFYDAEAGNYMVRDLGSRNGTVKGGQRINEAPLHDGDVIEIGKYRIVFEEFKDASSDPATIVQYDEKAKGFMDRTMIMQAPKRASLVVRIQDSETTVKITKQQTVLGSGGSADIPLKGWFIRRRHAVILARGPNYAVDPVGKTFVNENKLTGRHILHDGDKIRIRNNVIIFNQPED